jgi:hypothetical protein
MPHQRSIDYHGVGQSGYTAGRHDHDPALELELHSRNATYPRGADDEQFRHELDTDDRFTGRGGPILPEDEDEAPAG